MTAAVLRPRGLGRSNHPGCEARRAASLSRACEAGLDAAGHLPSRGELLASNVSTAQAPSNRALADAMKRTGVIRRKEVVGPCHLPPGQAKRVLARLKQEGRLQQHGVRNGAFYTLGEDGHS